MSSLNSFTTHSYLYFKILIHICLQYKTCTICITSKCQPLFNFQAKDITEMAYRQKSVVNGEENKPKKFCVTKYHKSPTVSATKSRTQTNKWTNISIRRKKKQSYQSIWSTAFWDHRWAWVSVHLMNGSSEEIKSIIVKEKIRTKTVYHSWTEN